MSKPTNTNSGQNKIFNSAVYRKKIKKMVEMAKNLNGLHRKIPRGDLPKLKESATAQQKSDRAVKNTFRVNIDTLHYFAHSVAGGRTVTAATTTTSSENTTATQ